MRCSSLAALAVVVAMGPGTARAATYVLQDLESVDCDHPILDEVVDGVLWDTYQDAPYHVGAFVRCSPATPDGTKHVEWQPPSAANNEEVDLILDPVTPVVTGTTYYLGGFFRFDRVGGEDIWRDQSAGDPPYQFDKLAEVAGAGFRWGIGSGWNGWYTAGADHRFTFDAWYATSVIGPHGDDHLVADQAPFGADAPYLCDYGAWYGVVLGVTAGSSETAGRVELWINGTKINDQPHYTALPAASLGRVTLHGTIAQPQYDSPSHLRRVDRVILTDDWQDILAGGYLDSGGSGGAGGAGGAGGGAQAASGDPESGCGCRASADRGSAGAGLVIVALLLAGRRRAKHHQRT